ncbi:MAG: hypothetical protein KIT22_15095, partial [Verrucomicrobiae bacterium]|nr:hypothetical protein [Verrucomicrobiae bacterium]
LAFGPEGILFAADTKGAAIVALDTGDVKPAAGRVSFTIEGLSGKLAALLGTDADEVLIEDLAVNPVSHQAYLAVSRGRGPAAVPALVRVALDGRLELVPLDQARFSKAELPDAPVDGVVGEGNRKSNPRLESITDLAFLEDRVLVAGLSNEEFSSTLRAIPFPFRAIPGGTGVEIYHGAHGRFETRAPVRTFVPLQVGDQPQVIAAYTCTPLVQFSLGELQPGAKVKGKTVAELGNRNRPLDMIVYEKDGKEYLLLANSSRGVLKVSTDGLAGADSISEPVRDGATQGLSHVTVAGWTGINQLDRLDANQALVVRRSESGADSLESLPLP